MNKINIQLLAFHQQKSTSIDKVKNFQRFERNKVVHAIVIDGNVKRFKEFIKYSKDDILEEYNENGQSLLHLGVIHKN